VDHGHLNPGAKRLIVKTSSTASSSSSSSPSSSSSSSSSSPSPSPPPPSPPIALRSFQFDLGFLGQQFKHLNTYTSVQTSTVIKKCECYVNMLVLESNRACVILIVLQKKNSNNSQKMAYTNIKACRVIVKM
jgi:hypothetical protein